MLKRNFLSFCFRKDSAAAATSTTNNNSNNSSNLFTSAFLKACTDTARWDLAVSVCGPTDSYGATRTALVTSIRQRDWKRALELCSSKQMIKTININDNGNGKDNSNDKTMELQSQTLKQILDAARLHHGVRRLLRRVHNNSDNNDNTNTNSRDQVVATFRSLTQQRVEELEQVRLQGIISETGWKRALECLFGLAENNNSNNDNSERDNNNNNNKRFQKNKNDRNRRQAFSKKHQSEPQTKINNTELEQESKSLTLSQRQTILTKLLHQIKKLNRQQHQHQHRHQQHEMMISSNNIWLKALNVIMKPAAAAATSTSTKNKNQQQQQQQLFFTSAAGSDDLHAGHVNALLEILVETGKYDIALDIAKKCFFLNDSTTTCAINNSDDSDIDNDIDSDIDSDDVVDTGDDDDSSNNNVIRRRNFIQPSSGTAMTLAVLVQRTRDLQLASLMLSLHHHHHHRHHQKEEEPFSKHLFPYAAWAACDVLTKYHGKWDLALKWYFDSGKHQDVKFSSHLKLMSCLSKHLKEKEQVLELMKDCKNVAGFERILSERNF